MSYYKATSNHHLREGAPDQPPPTNVATSHLDRATRRVEQDNSHRRVEWTEGADGTRMGPNDASGVVWAFSKFFFLFSLFF
jgi:hypothetical protein